MTDAELIAEHVILATFLKFKRFISTAVKGLNNDRH